MALNLWLKGEMGTQWDGNEAALLYNIDKSSVTEKETAAAGLFVWFTWWVKKMRECSESPREAHGGLWAWSKNILVLFGGYVETT